MTGGPKSNGSAFIPPPPAPTWSASPPPDEGVVERLAEALSLPSTLCAVLAAREVTDPDEAKRFLRPRLEDLHPPQLLKDLDVAAHRVLEAIRVGETILVHGDYDVDGVCATALLTLWLRRMGANIVPFVPHRLRDGYDLGPAGIQAAREAGATLLITCDSGILAHDAVAEARAASIDVIVTDHHTPGEAIPPAMAVVNPRRPDCAYPCADLCGTGVVFKLCQRLAELTGIDRGELWPHLDLVALATVADLVSLKGENRVLTRFGLRALAGSRKPGLQALAKAARLRAQDGLDAGQVGFVLAPRINAAGRMGHAGDALRLLLSTDPLEAAQLAAVLEGLNEDRRETDRTTLDDALARLAESFDPERDFGVVLAGEGWHPGVIGIVASRVVERVHRPVVLIALDGDRGRGSARSIAGVHLHQALTECGSFLQRFGGHRQAAGMDVLRDRIPAFRAAFNQSVKRQLKGAIPYPRVTGDLSLPLAQADGEFHRLLEYVGPFGMGNPRPIFWARELRVVGVPRVVGREHLKLRVTDGGGEMDAIGFGLALRVPPESLRAGSFEALFQLRENEYRGVRSLQARIIDLRPMDGTGPS